MHKHVPVRTLHEEVAGVQYGELDRYLVPLDAPLARRWFTDVLYARRALERPHLQRVSDMKGIEQLVGLLDEVPGAVPRAAAVYVRDPMRTLGFFFEEGADAPSAVAKAPFSRMEAQTLEQMRAFLPPALQPTLPRVLRFHESPRGQLLVMSMLPGRPAYVEMQVSLAPWRLVDAHFDGAVRWLAAFHDATRTTATTTVNGVAVPHSAVHGTFSPRNVLHDAGGTIGVVDWEHFIPAGSPFNDLFEYAATYGSSYFRRATKEEAFHRTFAANNRVSRAVQRYIREYATRVGLPHKVLLPAFDMWHAAGKLPL
ncbi:MAG TPA: hypothetical protein VGQ36_00460 [Thermoanaerobaculia bacterium]|nr:hypothetical protein [Thermoanaerobaculia bacterium]